MPSKDDKRKDAGKSAKKDKDPVSKPGGKAKEKRWSKGKVRDKLSNPVNAGAQLPAGELRRR